MSIRLYSDRFWISPWVFSPYIALVEKGLPFEVAELALDRKETQNPPYKTSSVTAKVPALEHDGFWLTESAAILDYLEELFPTPNVLPTHTRQRAQARQIMSFLRTDLYALREERPSSTMFFARAEKPLSVAAAADAQKLFAVATAFVSDGAMTLFDQWCIADSELAFCLQRLGLNGTALPARLTAFVDAQWNRPAVHQYVTRPRPDFVPY